MRAPTYPDDRLRAARAIFALWAGLWLFVGVTAFRLYPRGTAHISRFALTALAFGAVYLAIGFWFKAKPVAALAAALFALASESVLHIRFLWTHSLRLNPVVILQFITEVLLLLWVVSAIRSRNSHPIEQ